ncbi:hypothetical protein [Mycolicibacterium phlei]|uniref:hypothetical protein n=1 Tax=Mycolicibacterium phlei TaxID=1771 RepID=UPI00025AE3FB|nr:hypothetical protein [Mycolicibacterium phlei]EID14768.1 hypothetical protein MPHLEI_10549 [Mycolicibacterium phlei RIVM601174]MBF4191502.1 hypothetical protein [Mycolicibacterium phlei]
MSLGLQLSELHASLGHAVLCGTSEDSVPLCGTSEDSVPWGGGLRIGVGARVVINESW